VDATILGLATGLDAVAPNSTVFYSLNAHNITGLWTPVALSAVRFVVNAPGSAKIFGTPFGDMPRNYLRGPGINQLNMSIFKKTKIGERMSLQLQASAFNVLNHPNPGYGVNAVGGTATPNGYLPGGTLENAGLSTSGFNDRTKITYGRRVVQFGIRLIF
jgi:hypothetical protein